LKRDASGRYRRLLRWCTAQEAVDVPVCSLLPIAVMQEIPRRLSQNSLHLHNRATLLPPMTLWYGSGS
jgi:hypothetical protein